MRNLIVGVDGTDASAAALHWAAETVGPNGRIHAVVGVNPRTERLVDAISSDPMSFASVIEHDLIHRWTRDVLFAVGDLVASVSHAPMPEALDSAATADRADAIVIGAHQALGGVVKRIGHATNRLIRMTRHPVVVVGAGHRPPPLDGGNVVVGIGHGNATRSSVRWAARLNRSHPISLELVHATGDAPVFQADGVADLVGYEVGSTDRETWERGDVEHFKELMQTIAGPDIRVTVSTPPGLAAVQLDEASDRSALVVVGRHRSRLDLGHHTAQPLRHVLTHARCPVVVIADTPDDEIEGAA